MTTLLNSTNLLNLALTVIPPREIQWLKFDSWQTNAAGYDIPVYSSPITIQAMVQAMPNSMYEEHGLDKTKNYIVIHTSEHIQDTAGQKIADRFLIDGKFYNVTSTTDWYVYNGWVSVIACEDKTEIPEPTPPTPDEEVIDDNE